MGTLLPRTTGGRGQWGSPWTEYLPGSVDVRGEREGYQPVPVMETLGWPPEMEYFGEGGKSAGERSLTDTAAEGTDLRRMSTSAEEEDWIREDIRVMEPEAPSGRG